MTCAKGTFLLIRFPDSGVCSIEIKAALSTGPLDAFSDVDDQYCCLSNAADTQHGADLASL